MEKKLEEQLIQALFRHLDMPVIKVEWEELPIVLRHLPPGHTYTVRPGTPPTIALAFDIELLRVLLTGVAISPGLVRSLPQIAERLNENLEQVQKQAELILAVVRDGKPERS